MEISKTWLPFTFALLFASLVGAVTAVFFADQTSNIWAALTVAKAGLTAEYCELNHMEAAIRQPVNAWSNLCYTFLGAWTLFQAWTDIRSKSATNPMQRFLAMRIWIGLMLLGLGFGSFFFHASLTRLGQHFDMAFTYALTLSLGIAAIYRLYLGKDKKEKTKQKWLFLILAIALSAFFTAFKWQMNAKITLPLLMLGGMGLATFLYFKSRPHFSGKLLSAALLLTVLSGVFRSLDLQKVGCNSEGLYQSHAVWHFTTGLAAYLFLAFLLSEKSPSADNSH